MNNPIGWFEIATIDLERAKEFYDKVFKRDMIFMEMGEDKMYMFHPLPDLPGSGGALVLSSQNAPSTDGTIVYFQCDDVGTEASRVESAGGKLIVPKMSIGEFGFIAQCIDTEGNRIGLHSHK